jgi:hypothetical protein
VVVSNCIVVDAHTWSQAIGAFLLGCVVVVGMYRIRADGSFEPASIGSTRQVG